MILERRHQGDRKHDPILPSFPIAYQDLVEAEVDVLDPQPQAFHQTHAGAIEEGEQKAVDSLELRENAADVPASTRAGRAPRILHHVCLTDRGRGAPPA